MYGEWIKWAIVALFVIGVAWLGYRWWNTPMDGDPCEFDRECTHGICLAESDGAYCTKTCSVHEDCLAGWKCLQPVTRPDRHCIRR